MDLVLELLEWAQGKDIGEIYYENRSGANPVIVRLTFGQAGANAADGLPKKMGTIYSPAIGKLTLNAQKVKPGNAVQPKEVLGFVEGEGERADIQSLFHGKILEVSASQGASVNFAQPILLVEIE